MAFALLVLLAFSTAPSPLYALYAQRDHFSSLVITLIYGAYALGVAASLFFVSHRSDVHGRRPHLLGAVGLAVVSALVFIAWPSLPGLFAGRTLSGVSVGLTVSTATAYLDELHRIQHPRASAQLTVSAATLGGLGFGALLTGLLAEYASHPLVVPYAVLLGLLVVAGIAVAGARETRRRVRPAPPYRPQRATAPPQARATFFAALVGVLLAYAAPAVFVGLAGTFLAGTVHDGSRALAGAAIALVFAAGVAAVMVTRAWPARRLLAMGIVLEIAGLGLVVIAAWLPTPSLALFLVGGGVVGAAAASLFRGTLGSVVEISPPEQLGEALAGFFLSGYVGLSLPAIAVGVALQFVSPRAALLAFAVAVSAGILAASRRLLPRAGTPGTG